MVGVAVVVRVVGGIGVACRFLVRASHSFIPFRWFNYSTEIVTSQHIFLLQFCYGGPAKILAGAKKERMARCPLSAICLPTRRLKFVSPEQGATLCAHPTSLGVPSAPLLLPAHLSQLPDPRVPRPVYRRVGLRPAVVSSGKDLRTLVGRTRCGLCLPSTCALIIAEGRLLVKGFFRSF